MENKKRLIDADALLKDLQESHDRLREIYNGLRYDDERQICAGQLTTFVECALRIKEAPTIDAVVLPCKVGDTLYVITQTRDKRILPFINQYEATNIKVGKRKCVVYHEQDGFMKVFKQDDFGKTVFLTREEAEAALAKMDGDGNG